MSYVVEEALAGRSDQIKERIVGINVFGREPAYDTASDPVVRNAAIEVRKRLAQFYVESGQGSGIQIDLQPGAYVPTFRCSVEAAPPQFPQSPQPQSQPSGQRHRMVFVIVGSVLALLIAVGVVLHYRASDNSKLNQSPSPQSAAMATSSSFSTGVATGPTAVRILPGDLQSGNYVDRFGNQWMPDRYFVGGTPGIGTTDFYFPPEDPELFRTMRKGNFTYDIPLERNHAYELRLYFVEPQYRYGNKVGGDGENSRIFNVLANGKVILNDFDIIEDAGFASTTVRAFKDITAAQDGKLHLQFTALQSQALVNGIELLPEIEGKIPPIRLHAAPFYYTDKLGNRWSPDAFYVGGQLFSAGDPLTETADPDLFNVARLGNFYYAIPVPPGRYSLTLYFAETWFHSPGKRVFDVSCNGVMLLHNLDIFQEAGYSRVLKETFHGLQPNGQGKLLISFSPVVNYASVRAIEVVEDRR